eukprot:CAMPEP_0179211318 /NCGR_PEP_ID=MMETSP0797-20121207/365_1 /TAXON_ID=47934 /ORGANISM="Dinophysis acuminata, Strain DAEP01" /LENGTH=35 /DNA_ID= /DNA_START= /DNA_END= /DNA_ORIENTATION=
MMRPTLRGYHGTDVGHRRRQASPAVPLRLPRGAPA